MADGRRGSVPNVNDILGPPKVNSILGPTPAAPKAAPLWSPEILAQYAGPGRITSGRRDAAANAQVKGSPTSSHLTGEAYDWAPADGDTARAAKALAAAGIPFDQIIDEGSHVHVGYRPTLRGQVMGKGRPAPVPGVDDWLGPPKVDDLLGAAPVAAAPKDKAPIYNPAAELASNYTRRNRAGRQTFMEGARQQAPGDGQSADIGNTVGGLLKMGQGAYDVMIGAPLGATVDTILGKPVETATGGRIPKETIGDAANMAAGFLIGPKGAKVKAPADLEYVPFKATRAEKTLAKSEGAAPGPAPTIDDVLGPAPAATASRAAKFDVPPVDEILGPAPKSKVAAAGVEDSTDDILFGPAKTRVRTPGTLSLPEPKPVGLKEGILDAADAVQKIMAPATVGLGRDAASTIRRAGSEADLMAAQSAQTLVEHAAKVEKLPVEEQRGLVSYIEGRSEGAKLADPSLQKTADDIRKVNESYRNRIEDVMGVEDDVPSFIRDYYTHMWKEAPNVVEGRILAGRQGSGRNLKARSIPTLQEGIDAGLTPVTENPIEATTLYAQNMSKYLATVDTQGELVNKGMARYATPAEVPEGWVKLNGIRTEKPGRTIINDGEVQASVPGKKLYAPADVARVYNNWISPGLESGDLKPLFEGARKASNGMVMLKLGLSAFHATTMTNEAMISELARGYGALSRGDLKTGATAIAKSPGAFVGRAMRGDRMRKQLLEGDGARFGQGGNQQGVLDSDINKLYVQAGGRVRMDPLYRTRSAGSFYNAIHNGTWKSELQKAGDAIYGKDKLISQRAKGVIDLGANLIQTVSAPLFESYIPRLKMGAFASTMEDWLKANPNATAKQRLAAASDINRSIDNRFGEMAWDNLFWHRQLKQASQLLLLSPTWNLGTLNEIGGGVIDALGPSAKGLLEGKGVTPRTAYVVALATQVALFNAVMTYLKTGKPPQNARDLMTYRTGGTDASSGEPERALVPGYQKDVYAFGYDFPNHIGEEVENKLNPALKTALELSANKDFRDLPIRDKSAPLGDQAKQTGDYLLDTFMPISLGQLSKDRKKGSNLSMGERVAAIRPAPYYMTAPDKLQAIKKGQAQREWKHKMRSDAKAAAQREP